MSRKYRAFVIDGRKVIKHTVSVIIGIIASVAIIMGAKAGGVKLEMPDFNETEIERKETVTKKRDFSLSGIFNPWRIVSEEFTFLKHTEKALPVFNEKNADKKSVLPQNGTVVGLSGELPIKEIDSSQKKAIGTEKILIKNETNYSVSPNELLKEKLGLDMSKTGPKILIVHTHGSESYTEEGKEFYTEGTGDRNTDTSFNVVFVGDKIAEVFERAGIEVIHDRTMHDQPSYNGSYGNSLKAVEKYTEEYKSIQVVLDIHRDAIVYQDGTKAKTATEIDGKNAAQLMFVVGTNEGGLTHDNWRENLKFAVKLQSAINKKYPSLMRGINLRKERFNGHTTKGSLIIEVGTSGNTLKEAIYGATLAAEVIADFVNGI